MDGTLLSCQPLNCTGTTAGVGQPREDIMKTNSSLAMQNAVQAEILFPRSGMLVSQNFFPGFQLTVPDDAFLEEHRSTARLCFSISEDDGVAPRCLSLDSTSSVVENAPPGPTVMTAWAVDAQGQILSDRHSAAVEFHVASDAQIASADVETGQHSNTRLSSAESLLTWYWTRQGQQQQQPRLRRRKPGTAHNAHDDDEGSKARTGTASEDEGATDILQRSPRQISRLASACYRSAGGDEVDGDEDDGDGGDDELSPLLLVIGVKSAVGHFDRRQAIRDTWMGVDLGPSLTERVCLQFITGSPRVELPVETASALQLEAYIFGDLLLASGDDVRMDGARNPSQPSSNYEVFGVVDHYDNLLSKATGFMEIAIERFKAFRYLLMMDDDVYLRLDRLVEALLKRPPHLDNGGFYAGQVFEDELQRPIRPRRHPEAKNSVSRAHWPLDVLPRFALGPHYILSRYCVEFIARNKNFLHGVGALEDVSVALWMLAIQGLPRSHNLVEIALATDSLILPQRYEFPWVHPVHLDNFMDSKLGCSDLAMSMASLGPLGLRAVHDNLLAGAPFCSGFDEAWQSFV